jgi:hypothetical protein
MAMVADYLNTKLRESTGVVSDNQKIGIGKFTLDVRVKEDVIRTMAVPTTPLEDGSFANDHVIENPLQLQISGEVSNVRYQESEIQSVYKRSVQQIGVVTKYLPQQTRSQVNKSLELANSARQIIRKIDDVIADGEQILGMFGNRSADKLPTDIFMEEMELLQQSKQIIIIQAQGRVYKNMILTSVTATRDNKTNGSLTYKIVAQEIRFAEVIYVGVSRLKKNGSKDLNGQMDGSKEKGLNKPKKAQSVADWGLEILRR